jgi:hypothetical protein
MEGGSSLIEVRREQRPEGGQGDESPGIGRVGNNGCLGELHVEQRRVGGRG